MRSNRSIPVAPWGLPLIGHLAPLARDPLGFLSSLPDRGGLVRIGLGGVGAVVVCDPELTQQVLRHDRIFDKGGPIMERGREVIGNGLVTSLHPTHRRQRRLLQPAFTRDRIAGYAEKMSEYIAGVSESWSDGAILDVPHEMQRLSALTTAATLFPDTVPEDHIRALLADMNTVFESVIRRVLLPRAVNALPTPANRAFRLAIARVHETVDEIIHKRRTAGDDRGDLISALLAMENTDDDGRGMTDAEITDQIITLFLGGTETTASVLLWALYLLDQHPDIAARLRAEVDTALTDRVARYADLPGLPITRNILTETLRIRPPAWILTRVVTEDTELGGHRLAAGTSIVYSPYILHHRPDLFPDPERFDPDRWACDAPISAATRNAFAPFGGGARKCIGDHFAMIEATLALATIAARWTLRTLPDRDVRPAVAVSLYPRRLRMSVSERARGDLPVQTIRS
ncbi:cytochrome P450 [Nocardia pseudobrasiliensis]|uniref:Pentalenene oxygenase n=1 Tax=Nocardia pseudobrasiliensis TaxID=45979 RepID=A0A370HY25_9NOCA|nr:cytochrome P450 [Nocardia pseudobrasiliensis]RDI63359.1 pentalenene oxygenase [Nocardia pseudobrasiliensis]